MQFNHTYSTKTDEVISKIFSLLPLSSQLKLRLVQSEIEKDLIKGFDVYPEITEKIIIILLRSVAVQLLRDGTFELPNPKCFEEQLDEVMVHTTAAYLLGYNRGINGINRTVDVKALAAIRKFLTNFADSPDRASFYYYMILTTQ